MERAAGHDMGFDSGLERKEGITVDPLSYITEEKRARQQQRARVRNRGSHGVNKRSGMAEEMTGSTQPASLSPVKYYTLNSCQSAGKSIVMTSAPPLGGKQAHKAVPALGQFILLYPKGVLQFLRHL